jgi:hypothetical protein
MINIRKIDTLSDTWFEMIMKILLEDEHNLTETALVAWPRGS